MKRYRLYQISLGVMQKAEAKYVPKDDRIPHSHNDRTEARNSASRLATRYARLSGKPSQVAVMDSETGIVESIYTCSDLDQLPTRTVVWISQPTL